MYGAIFPPSEVAAGGDYNLHFLPAHFRRTLRPQMGTVKGPQSTPVPNSGPPHALTPRTSISLYMPQAGFLWSDDLVWEDGHGLFMHNSHDEFDGKQGSCSCPKLGSRKKEPPPHRAFFVDRINRRYPWSLVPSGLYETEYQKFVLERGYLVNSDVVFIQSEIDGRYLGVQGETLSIIDREAGVEFDEAQPFQRLRVGYVDSTFASIVHILTLLSPEHFSPPQTRQPGPSTTPRAAAARARASSSSVPPTNSTSPPASARSRTTTAREATTPCSISLRWSWNPCVTRRRQRWRRGHRRKRNSRARGCRSLVNAVRNLLLH